MNFEFLHLIDIFVHFRQTGKIMTVNFSLVYFENFGLNWNYKLLDEIFIQLLMLLELVSRHEYYGSWFVFLDFTSFGDSCFLHYIDTLDKFPI